MIRSDHIVAGVTDWIEYLRRYRPAMSREEVAVAAEISVATLTRRLRDGLDADEVIRSARAVGASPTEALMVLGLLAPDDVHTTAATSSLATVSERTLLEELLARAVERDTSEAVDREEAGLPPAPHPRFVLVSDPGEMLDYEAAKEGDPDEELNDTDGR